jgi:hypothetical protein
MHPILLTQLVEQHTIALLARAAEQRLTQELRAGQGRYAPRAGSRRSAPDRTGGQPHAAYPVSAAA